MVSGLCLLLARRWLFPHRDFPHLSRRVAMPGLAQVTLLNV